MKHKVLLILLFTIIIFQACSSEDDLINKIGNKQIVGSSANDLLSDAKFKNLFIELVYVEGFEPTLDAIDNFKSFINTRCFKPNGIIVEKRSIQSFGNTEYSFEEIADIEDANRTKYNNGEQISIWVFFSDGKSDKDDNSTVVLGSAYRNTSFVIFEETIRHFSDGLFEPKRNLLETTVINHEFGHLMGLTNFGTNLQSAHEDPDHTRHCNVQSCLMYWETVTGSGISNMNSTGLTTQLDAQCIADLQANGGK